jgi:hypothetical protein
MALPDPSTYHPDMLESGLSILGLLTAGVALALVGAAPAYLQRRVLALPKDPQQPLVRLLGPVTVAAFLVYVSLPPDVHRFLVEQLGILSEGWLACIVRLTAMFLITAGGALLSAGWWDRVHAVGATRATRFMPPLMPMAMVSVLAGWLILMLWPRGESASPHFTGLAWMHIPLSLLFFFGGLNAGALARAWSNRGIERFTGLAIAVVPTLVTMALTYWLFSMSLRIKGSDWSSAQVLLGTGQTGPTSLPQTALRWAIEYLIVVNVLGLGGWLGIRLAPRPKLGPSSRSSVVVPILTHVAATPEPEPAVPAERLA